MRTAVWAIVLCSLLASGCVTVPLPVNIAQMTLPLETGARFNGNAPLAGRVVLGAVTTFEDKYLLGVYTPDRIAEFREALKRSLADTQLAAFGAPDFALHAVVMQADESPSGDSFTVGVAYVLVPAAGGAPVMQKTITTSDGPAGPGRSGERQDLARNVAFRKNIEQAIETLYRVKPR